MQKQPSPINLLSFLIYLPFFFLRPHFILLQNSLVLLLLVLLGQSELITPLKNIPNFFDRISFKTMLLPLDYEETKELIYFRIRKAGYQSKMDRLFGTGMSNGEKLEKIFTDLAVALLHKQTKMFCKPKTANRRIHISVIPLVPGTPLQLIKGRIDLRAMSKSDSDIRMTPWTGKGYLRMKNNAVRPAMRGFRHLGTGAESMVKGSVVFRRDDLWVAVSADYSMETDGS